MGETEIRTSESWGSPLTQMFDHKLVRLMSEADAATLGREESAALIYDELRSFMALKSALRAGDPPETLEPAHAALVHFAARMFKAAHQALIYHGRPLVPTGRFLLEWQLARLRSARHRLVMELAELAEKDTDLYRSLDLPEPLPAEVETARTCVSAVWARLPDWPPPSPRRNGPGPSAAG